MKTGNHKLIALLTNHDDDIYCFRKELIERLVEEGYQILISCPYGVKLDLINKMIPYEFEHTSIDRRGMNLIKDFKLLLFYINMLRRHKPSIVLTYTIKPNIYGSIAARINRIPYMNNVTGLGSVIKFRCFVKGIILMMMKFAFKDSCQVFFQNQDNMNLAKELKLVRNNYQLIPGSGVNVNRFKLEEYPSSSNPVIFNYIGRVMRDKGVDDYIEAAKCIKQRYHNTQFNVYGFIEPTELYYEKVFRELKEKDIINYHGSQLDIRPCIAKSHCTIHPSVYGEGMSNVLLESAASGRPIITTDTTGCKEIVDDGVNGYVYHAGDREQLINKIDLFMKLNTSLRSQMGISGRNKVCKLFSRDFVVDAYLKQIKLLIS